MKRYGLKLVAGAFALALVNHSAVAQEAAPAAEPKPVELTGGASAITETHGDWTVNCQVIRNTKICSFSFQQFEKPNNQRVFAIELSSRDNGATGNLALPFGLALAKGVTLKIDDQPVEGSLPFSTCVIAGCLIPLNFDEQMLANMQIATTLTISAAALDNGREVNFSVPLRGFTSALKRTAQLLAD